MNFDLCSQAKILPEGLQYLAPFPKMATQTTRCHVWYDDEEISANTMWWRNRKSSEYEKSSELFIFFMSITYIFGLLFSVLGEMVSFCHTQRHQFNSQGDTKNA